MAPGLQGGNRLRCGSVPCRRTRARRRAAVAGLVALATLTTTACGGNDDEPEVVAPGLLDSLEVGDYEPAATLTELAERSDRTAMGTIVDVEEGWRFGDGPDDPEATRKIELIVEAGELDGPIHVSGTPLLGLLAAVNDVDTNFGVILVDYGPETLHVSTSSEGVGNVESGEEDCWGESSASDDACYVITEKRTTTDTQWRVSKGIVDALNIYDVTTPTPLVPDDFYEFEFELLPVDYVFEEGHQIGIIVVGSYRSYSSQREFNEATITLSVSDSRLALPIVGGLRAASAAGIPSSNRHN